VNQVSPVNDYPAVYAAIMIPTAVPSTIVLSTDNDRSAFTVASPKAAIVIAMADPHVDILSECWDCNAQSHKRRNNQKPAAHRTISSSIYAAAKANIYTLNPASSGKFQWTCELLREGLRTCWLRLVGGKCCGLVRG
jgi:hypothetical protein